MPTMKPMTRMSLDYSALQRTASSNQDDNKSTRGGAPLRRFDVTDLTRLDVHIEELRLATDRTKLFALQVRCAGRQWELLKRYSQIREFWLALCTRLDENQHSCSERCHFLAGLDGDKFPKKRLLHTRGALESRATELDAFFQKVTMRLNLCNARELRRCHVDGCTTLALLLAFFEIESHCNSQSVHPHSVMTSYQSMPLLLKDRSREGRRSHKGRMSLAGLQEFRPVSGHTIQGA